MNSLKRATTMAIFMFLAVSFPSKVFMVVFLLMVCSSIFYYACCYDTFCPGRQKVSKKRPFRLLRRIPATRFAEFFTSLIFVCCSAAGFVNTPAKNSCACPLLAMFAEHRCACGPVVRSGLRSAKGGVLFVNAKSWRSETLCVVLRASVSLALLILFSRGGKKYPKNALQCCFAGFRRLDSQNFSRR